MSRSLMALGMMLACWFWQGVAAAGQVAVYRDPSQGDLTIELSDSGMARVSTGAPNQYLIMRDNTAYLVGAESDGALSVMQLETVAQAIGKALGTELATLFQKVGEAVGKSRLTVKPKGTTETVAGFKGDVYLVTGLDGSDPKKATEFVVSSAPELKPIGAAYQRFMESTMVMAAPLFGSAVTGMIGEMRQVFALGAPIKSEGKFELVSVTDKAFDDAYFALPATPMSLEQVQAKIIRQ